MNVVFSASAALFRRIDRGDEHYTDRGAGGVEGFVRLLVDIVRFIQQFEPITGLVRLFERDLQFCDKIRLAVGELRFTDIRADGRAGASDLVGDDRFVFRF